MNVQITRNGFYDWTVIIDGAECERFFHGTSSCRMVFRLGNKIVKFDTVNVADAKNYLHSQCITEKYFWENIVPEDSKQYFAELLASGVSNGFPFVVQKFYPNDYSGEKMSPELEDTLKNLGLYDFDNAEGRLRNWHWSDGKPIVYDYGCFEGAEDFWMEYQDWQLACR